MKRQLTLISLLAGALCVAIGCSSQPHNDYVNGEIIPPDDQPRQIDKLLEAQEAAGAGMDATLHLVHFDGDMLNTLGQQKLDLMLKDEHACCPLTVYLELPKDDPMLQGRTEAIALYLKDRGLSDDQFTVKVGPNTSYSSPAADSVRELRVLDAGAGTNANTGPTGGTTGQ
ncbi:MAG TPA: hypothetical protein VHY37_03860 [Tepidisphaeraceae bacterium]|nr:hypothetical protein [Tepidisphaeraceae bacterium]